MIKHSKLGSANHAIRVIINLIYWESFYTRKYKNLLKIFSYRFRCPLNLSNQTKLIFPSFSLSRFTCQEIQFSQTKQTSSQFPVISIPFLFFQLPKLGAFSSTPSKNGTRKNRKPPESLQTNPSSKPTLLQNPNPLNPIFTTGKFKHSVFPKFFPKFPISQF